MSSGNKDHIDRGWNLYVLKRGLILISFIKKGFGSYYVLIRETLCKMIIEFDIVRSFKHPFNDK